MLKISIIIPFRDRIGLLDQCVLSILKKSTYKNYEIILANNNSQKKETKKYLAEISKNPLIKIISYQKPFNFSAINNFAARQVASEFLLFLNNDTEIISENWIEKMLKQFEDPKVGAVGAKLLYPSGKIQHAGIVLNNSFIAANAFRKFKDNKNSGEEFNKVRKWSAVTAACMMTRKRLFEEVGGFDEKNLPIAYNDVDYCLKLREKGYEIIYTPYAKLYHHESASRTNDIFAKIFNRKRNVEFQKEQEYMQKRWDKKLESDPYYSAKYL